MINPPTGRYMRDDRCQAPVDSMTAQPGREPLDLAYMAATLEEVGVSCKIRDYPFEKVLWNAFQEDLVSFKPDFVIVSTTTPTLEYDMAACRIAKDHNPTVVTVGKGAEITNNPGEVLMKYPELDIAICGEYEFAIAEIATMDWKNVKGISFRDGGKIIFTKKRPRLKNLDELPFPARHLLKNDLYFTPDTGEPIAFILTGRGCPHRCIYCAVSVASGFKLYIRSVESVIREIEQCNYDFGIRNFFFRSDTFTWYENWVVDLCKQIINKGFDIRWGTNSRVDTINEKRLKWMKKAGCYVIGFGIESGSQELLEKMKKKATLAQARTAIALCKKYKVKTYLLFLFGLPWETRKSAEKTIQFAKELDGDFADFNIAYPLPGTELYEIAKRDHLFEGSLSGYDYGAPLIHSYHLSNAELIEIRKRAICKFYFRPKYVIRTLLGIRSPRVFFSYLRNGMSLAKRMRFSNR